MSTLSLSLSLAPSPILTTAVDTTISARTPQSVADTSSVRPSIASPLTGSPSPYAPSPILTTTVDTTITLLVSPLCRSNPHVLTLPIRQSLTLLLVRPTPSIAWCPVSLGHSLSLSPSLYLAHPHHCHRHDHISVRTPLSVADSAACASDAVCHVVLGSTHRQPIHTRSLAHPHT